LPRRDAEKLSIHTREPGARKERPPREKRGAFFGEGDRGALSTHLTGGRDSFFLGGRGLIRREIRNSERKKKTLEKEKLGGVLNTLRFARRVRRKRGCCSLTSLTASGGRERFSSQQGIKQPTREEEKSIGCRRARCVFNEREKTLLFLYQKGGENSPRGEKTEGRELLTRKKRSCLPEKTD